MTSPYYLSSNPIPYNVLCSLSSSEVQRLKRGLNFLELPSREQGKHKPQLIRLLIYQNDDRSFVVCRNLCRHAGGHFVHDIEDAPPIVRCAFHGWKLNVQTLEYVKPADCLKQKPLVFDRTADGELLILEPVLYEPWTSDSEEKHELQNDELTITYLGHGGVEIRGGGTRLVVDPWLTGPAYDRSWWLLHEIDESCFNRIATADGIFISKQTPDHCNVPTLQRIRQINPHIHIYTPVMIVDAVKQLGFVNVHPARFGVWEQLRTSDCRLMVLPDHKHPRHDFLLLFEYKGHRILNLIDCCSPNGDYLPYGVDVLLTNFTSNKTAYPSCFVDQFGEEKVLDAAKRKDENFVKTISRFIQLSNPAVWIPTGGYFLEAGPDDEQVRRLNWKNDPSNVADALKSRFPFLRTWCPFPEGTYDVGRTMADQSAKSLEAHLKNTWSFQFYIDQLDQSLNFEPLTTMQGIEEYFRWSAFRNYDLVLHLIELSNDFSDVIREYYVDFLHSEPTLLDSLPKDRPYLRIRIRASVIRDVLMRGSSWHCLFHGFSARYFAEPNVYHRKFWDHFKYHLPADPPPWYPTTVSSLLETLERCEINDKAM